MSYLLKKILIGLAWAQIRRYKPMIIGVTGNAGKTSTKETIAAVLRHSKTVRIAAGNLNNEFGFALTILGDWDQEYYDHGSSMGLWLRVLWAGCRGLIARRDCAEIFLLEYGADRPGDIKRLAMVFKPHIAVITTVGDTPVHIEFFKNADSVAAEKANLVKVLTAVDYAILNHDDDRVLDMKSKTEAHVVTYGFEEGSTIRILDFKYLNTDEGKPTGVAFKIHEASKFVSVEIGGSLGKSQAYAAAAAAAIGMALGMNLIQISEALQQYHGPNGRLKILSGINGSTIIDDTYNASPASTRLALETLRDLPGLRKIAVLGDMLELGEHTIPAHQNIGTLAASCADILVCVGSRAKFIADSAANQMSKNNIFTFDVSTGAIKKVRELVEKGDLILIKGSQGMRMEKIVEEIMAESQRKKELLVRQSERWLFK
ncbi:MAG: UDP-N-acetylmuramoyl-tripeptide--D-alanyl-D-alanine ligase [Patescibacteria group bacterium]